MKNKRPGMRFGILTTRILQQLLVMLLTLTIVSPLKSQEIQTAPHSEGSADCPFDPIVIEPGAIVDGMTTKYPIFGFCRAQAESFYINQKLIPVLEAQNQSLISLIQTLKPTETQPDDHGYDLILISAITTALLLSGSLTILK